MSTDTATLESISKTLAALDNRLKTLEETRRDDRPRRSRSPRHGNGSGYESDASSRDESETRSSHRRSKRPLFYRRGGSVAKGGKRSSPKRRPSRSRSRSPKDDELTRRTPRGGDPLTRDHGSSEKTPAHWADRDEERVDYTARITWPEDPDGEAPECSHLTKVSDATANLLKTSFSTPVSNTTRLEWKRLHLVPDVDNTKCPKLDPVVKAEVGSQTKSADAELARIQTLVLDAVGPLATVLEDLTAPEGLTESVKLALHYLGNASANISKMRRKKVLKDLNPDLLSLAEQDETFSTAAPLLFGQGFSKKAKEHTEEVKSLRKSAPIKQFFRGGRPFRGITGRGGRIQPFNRGYLRDRQGPTQHNHPRGPPPARGRGGRHQQT